MCFSASASFTASAILIVGGVMALKKAKKPSQIPFASIPILFALQQFSEGFVWLSLTNSDYIDYHSSSTYMFLFFAQVVWPALVPISIMLLEKEPTRKKAMMVFSIMGSLVSIYLAINLFIHTPKTLVMDFHIQYELDFLHGDYAYSGYFYFIPTIMPALISSTNRMLLFGLSVLASFLVSKLFFEDQVISVWCFFAAIISLLIIRIIDALNKPLVDGVNIT